MAHPILIVLGKSFGLKALTDKRGVTAIGTIILACTLVLLVPLLCIFVFLSATKTQYSIIDLSFNREHIPKELKREKEFIENMRIDFAKIDSELRTIDNDNADRNFIKSVYYVLYSNGDINIYNDVYNEFVGVFFVRDVFVPETEEQSLEGENEGLENEPIVTYTYITDKEIIYNKFNIGLKKQKQIEIIYSYITTGNIPIGISNLSGLSADALKDKDFKNLMEEATKYIGYPYVWGGSNPQTSFDCSGYICYVYTKSNTYNLARTTAQGIYNQSIYVSANEVKAGDLVFFTGTYSTTDTITHIGIYVGDNKMLHAGDPIGYADITSSYWSKHFYSFGRLPIEKSEDKFDENQED